MALLLVHRLEAGAGARLLLVGVLLLGGGAAQYVEVEGHEGRTLETQRERAVLDLVCQIGARPVEYGHEVVCYAVYAALGEVAYRLFVGFDVALEVARLGLDVLVYGDALHDTPRHAGIGYHLLSAAYLLHGPHLAVGDVVQGVYDIRRAGLPYVG